MASVNVYDRLSSENSGKKRIDGVDIAANVDNLKEKIVDNLKITDKKFNIIYCGQCLKENASLESYGIKSGSTVHLIPDSGSINMEAKKSDISNTEIRQLLSLLQTTLKSPAYKHTVENIVNSPDLLHNIVKDIPGLNDSPSTISIFMDSELLAVLAHPGNIRRLIEAHPCLPQLANKISEAIKSAEKSGDFSRSSTGTYSLDDLSDDDEDSAGPSNGQAITANQLAAALAAATGGSSPANESRPITGNIITSDFFQQAIQQAQMGAMTSQVQQMREMGITDENAARQALQATNGDLQAALDLLFGGGFS
ncbi:Ubiquitin-like protein 7 [Mactra antiquata]